MATSVNGSAHDPGDGSNAPPAPPVLEVRDLVKTFGGIHALDGVTLDAKPGSVTALVGENGAGKSTLIKCLVGVYQPDAGDILIDGVAQHFSGPFDARAAGLETVYQNLALAENLDVAANIFLGREARHGWAHLWALDKRFMWDKAREMLDDFGIHGLATKTEVRQLSGGQRQGVGIARATGWGTKAIIMDEPTAALGVRESQRVLDVVAGLAEKNLAVLLVSHNIPQVLEVSHHIWVLRAGRLVASLESSQTTHKEVVEHITGMYA